MALYYREQDVLAITDDERKAIYVKLAEFRDWLEVRIQMVSSIGDKDNWSDEKKADSFIEAALQEWNLNHLDYDILLGLEDHLMPFQYGGNELDPTKGQIKKLNMALRKTKASDEPISGIKIAVESEISGTGIRMRMDEKRLKAKAIKEKRTHKKNHLEQVIRGMKEDTDLMRLFTMEEE